MLVIGIGANDVRPRSVSRLSAGRAGRLAPAWHVAAWWRHHSARGHALPLDMREESATWGQAPVRLAVRGGARVK
jgi:hypothetical protein